MENRSVSFGITGIGLVVALVALAFRGAPSPATQVAVDGVPPASVTREGDVQYGSVDSAVAAYSRGRRLVAEYLAPAHIGRKGSGHTARLRKRKIRHQN